MNWLLIFMFSGQPSATVGKELDECLYAARVSDAREVEIAKKDGRAPFKAHCWNPKLMERRWPDGRRQSAQSD